MRPKLWKSNNHFFLSSLSYFFFKVLYFFCRCFEVFRFIHHLTDNLWAIRQACIDVIKEFASENVLYIELRTTPRKVEGSFENYLDAVIEAIECEAIFSAKFIIVINYVLKLTCLNIYLFHNCGLKVIVFYSLIFNFSQCREEKVPTLVKLLPSIDRSKGLEMAQQVADLAIRYNRSRPDIVVGLDVSGNMMTSKIDDFFPLLSKVRNSGLKLA